MEDQNTNTPAANPVLASLSNEEIMALAVQRGLKVKAAPAKVEKPVKSDSEVLLEALGNIVRAEVVNDENGSHAVIVVLPEQDRSDEDRKVIFEGMTTKARISLAKVAAAHKPPTTGAKRGRKSNAEKAAQAAASQNPDQPQA